MRPDDRTRILHMVEAADAAVEFAKGREREDLDRDRMLEFALVRATELIGEAAGRVSLETRSAHPEIPWEPIVGMRHRLVHAYFDINRDILWTTVTTEVPPLLAALRGIVAAEQ